MDAKQAVDWVDPEKWQKICAEKILEFFNSPGSLLLK
jgi:hypothetical protein